MHEQHLSRNSKNPKSCHEDDLYEGYGYASDEVFSSNNFPPLKFNLRESSDSFYERNSTARTQLSSRSSSRVKTGARPLTTSSNMDQSEGLNRPMTAIRSANFVKSTSSSDKSHTVSSKEIIEEETPVKKIQKLELRIWEILDESALASSNEKYKKALELGKEAQGKEKLLIKLEEEENVQMNHDWDLTYSVIFNLALRYEENQLFTNALHSYSLLTTEKFVTHGPEVKLSIGNIYLLQNQHMKAIKMYRMALDQLGKENKNLRVKILHNMGLVFLKTGSYTDAISSFESIMIERPSIKAAFHLVIANYMTKDIGAIRTSFSELLQIPRPKGDEFVMEMMENRSAGGDLLEIISKDSLTLHHESNRKYAEKCILTGGKLVATSVEESLIEGHDWVIEMMLNSDYIDLAQAIEICKGIELIKLRKLNEAIDLFHEFENKETNFLPLAATNLSFIYFLKGDIALASKYAHISASEDSYNAKGLLNLGNSLAALGDYSRARELFIECFNLDSSLIESYYNLGLVDQLMGSHDSALESFKKVTSLLPNFRDAMFQSALCYELLGEYESAVEYYLKVVGISQYDGGVYKKLGLNSDRIGEREEAFRYYNEAFKLDPFDLMVVKWLAKYMFEADNPSLAIKFYQRCSLLQPDNIKWLKKVARLHKILGNLTDCRESYEKLHLKFPNDIEALEYLADAYKSAELNKSNNFKHGECFVLRLEKLKARLLSAPRSNYESDKNRDDGEFISQIAHFKKDSHDDMPGIFDNMDFNNWGYSFETAKVEEDEGESDGLNSFEYVGNMQGDSPDDDFGEFFNDEQDVEIEQFSGFKIDIDND